MMTGIQKLPRWIRWSIKAVILAVTIFLVCFPNPFVFVRHATHWRDPNNMIDAGLPELQPWVEELRGKIDPELDPAKALRTVERFVYEKIEYDWDWETWGSADYLPTLAETLALGREDCDGRAVVAASLLRNLGYKADLVTDFTHVWVKTDKGETMSPGKRRSVEGTDKGLLVHWETVANLPKALAYGLAVFPLPRELIVLMVMWWAMLDRRVPLRLSFVALILLFVGLLFMRLGGEDPYQPALWAQWLGMAHIVAAPTWIYWCLRRAKVHSRRAGTQASVN